MKKERFSLQKILKGYIAYIQKYLLDDECLSFGMAVLDLKKGELEYAGYGMYPLLLREWDKGHVEQLAFKRPNLMRGDALCEICVHPLPEVFSLFLYSDGVCNLKGFSYQDFLTLVKTEEACAEIEQTVLWKFDSESELVSPKDDMTLICISSSQK